MSVTLPEAIIRYVNYKVDNKIWTSHTTVKNDTAALDALAREVSAIYGCDPYLSDIESPLILKAIDRRWPNTGKTTTHKVSTGRVKALFSWLVKRGYVDSEKVDALLAYNPEKPDIEKKYASQEDVEKTFAVLKARGKNRDAYLVALTFWMMRRGGEMVRLSVGDIDFTPTADEPHGHFWYVEGKGKRGRQRVMLRWQAKKLLEEYLAWYAAEIGRPLEDDDFLFPRYIVNGVKAGIGGRSLVVMRPKIPILEHDEIYRDAWKAAGVYESKKGGHACRRGGMSDAFEKLDEAGYADPIEHIMALSGHKSRAVAEAYIDKDAKRLRAQRAFNDIDAPTAPKPEEVSQPASNVISFGDRLRSRGMAG